MGNKHQHRYLPSKCCTWECACGDSFVACLGPEAMGRCTCGRCDRPHALGWSYKRTGSPQDGGARQCPAVTTDAVEPGAPQPLPDGSRAGWTANCTRDEGHDGPHVGYQVKSGATWVMPDKRIGGPDNGGET